MNPDWKTNYTRYKTYFLNVAKQYRERTDAKVYIEILLSLATVTIFSIFALRPTLITIAQLIKDVETKEQILATLNGKIENISKSQVLYDQQRRNISLLMVAVPERATPNLFIRQVEGLTFKHQLDVDTVKVSGGLILGKSTQSPSNTPKTEDEPQSDTYTFSFNINTDPSRYDSIKQFLIDLESLRIPVEISSVTFSTDQKKDSDVPILNCAIQGSLPYLEKTERNI